MLRVGYLFERFPSFGQTFCYREVAELKRQGAEVEVFSIRRPTDEPAEDWREEIVRDVRYLPEEQMLVKEVGAARDLPVPARKALQEWGRKTDFLRLYQACWIGTRLRESGIGRLHAHFAGMAARTAYWVKKFFGIQYSLTAHAHDIFAPREFEISLAKLFKEANAIVTVSDFAVAQLKERFPEHGEKFERVYNGIELTAAPRVPATPPTILSVGRLIEKKGFVDLIEACARLRASDIDFRCEIIGDGPLQPQLDAQIAALALKDRVCLLGPRSQNEIASRLAQSALFTLACKPTPDGDMDNLPTVILEAMAAGLPIISTHLAGIPEMVESGVNGELVGPGDIEALTGALARFISKPDLAREMGERSREIAQTKFSLAANVRALARILGEL